MKIWTISDTHGGHDKLVLPDGIDMVIHAGDCSVSRIPEVNYHEVMKFIEWYSALDVKHKIFVPGNHDTSIERGLVEFPEGITVLKHEGVVIEGINIFGSPYTPTFGKWAFMVPRNKLRFYWDLIPTDTDILITHGPPEGILDRNQMGTLCGCEALRKQLKWLDVKYHIFGHIHEQCGQILQFFNDPTTYINASVCNLDYIIDNNGDVIDI